MKRAQHVSLGGVLLSAELFARIREHVEVEEITGLTLKGTDHPVSAYVLKSFREMSSSLGVRVRG